MQQEIKDLDVLLRSVLGDTKTIASYRTRSLISAGENYGSVMLALDVTIKDKKTKGEEELQLVAKMCPPTEFIKKMFNIPVTYKKEVHFYSKVIPALQEFQRERGCQNIIDFFPKYYGSRFNLHEENEEIDDDACLLLENIKVKGYDIGERLKGFNLETAEYVIKDLARFHAVPIALKIAKPELFDTQIRPYLTTHMNEDMLSEEMNKGTMNRIMETAKQNHECAKYLDRIGAAMKKNADKFLTKGIRWSEPFGTIVHNDYWVNNTMLMFDESGKPKANAMVDFQMILYGNPAHDLIFFIYSSLNNDIIADHCDKLIDLYYDTFIEVLRELKIDTDPFNRELFLEQVDLAAREWEFYHIMFMLKPIFTDKSKVKDLSDINENEITNCEGVSEMYYGKLWGTVLDFARKNWI